MSYSHYAKNLLCNAKNRRKCCDTALLYGVLINSSVFSKERIKYVTENEVVAGKAESLINAVLNLNSNMNIKFRKATHQTYQIEIADVKLTGKLMKKFKYAGDEKDFRRINKSVFLCDSCKGSFMRGLFISCGTMSEPTNSYHLEISLNSERLAFEIKDLLKGNGRDNDESEDENTATDIEFKYIRRKNSHILYLKGSETIEDFLYYINAAKISFDIMEVKILKEVRNNVNRVSNIENANLKKISGAAAEQIVAINAIINDGKFESLPEELKQTARLRLDNIELSLQEIGELSEPKLTKSGVNHRIKKLIEISTNGGK